MNKDANLNDNLPADLTCPWFPVDNAANLYAAARRRDWCRTYRTTMVLDHEIDADLLNKALVDTMPRFPSLQARLRDGLFWSYFERTDGLPKLHEDTDYPYRPIALEGTDEPNFRISYYKNRVALEGFHSLSDGGGTDIFLSTLVAHYFELRGETIPKTDICLDIKDIPLESEVRDDYCHNALADVKAKNVEQPDVYLFKEQIIDGYARVFHGLFRVEDVKRQAKLHNLTITEFLTASLIYTFIRCEKNPVTKPVSLSIPINLRKRFPSKSIRNFVYMTDVSFEPRGKRDISFEDICNSIKGEIKAHADKDILLNAISANVKAQNTPVLRPIPYPLKRAFLKLSYKKSQLSYTAFYSNLGELELPPELSKHIIRAESIQGFTPYAPFGCASVSVNGLFNFSFCSSNPDTEKQKFFFRFLASQGIPVRIESNIYE